MKATSLDELPILPYTTYNIGCGKPNNLPYYISTLEEVVLPADYVFIGYHQLVELQAGDVPGPYAYVAAWKRIKGLRQKS